MDVQYWWLLNMKEEGVTSEVDQNTRQYIRFVH